MPEKPEPHTDTRSARGQDPGGTDASSAASRSPATRFFDFLERFHWLHTSLGLAGNLAFFVGSVFFLWESTKLAGIWLFIVGSLGMLMGSIGDKAASFRDDA